MTEDPEDVDAASDDPLVDTTGTTSPSEVTQPGDDEDVTPDSGLEQENDSAASQSGSVPADQSGEAGDSTPEAKDVERGQDHVEQPSKEGSAASSDAAAA